ncbi:hypothetical protein Taro_011828 [Colocasia esculenta]|uniref:Filament-like plant protein 3 n=1 Tax=Colocasia esculenta TaxID=4460 RepID=A0A843UBZ7_COLES|nr:hypothetical protein [Colocasia esculenta]
MDRRSWLWRRKSSDKSPGETESSGSVSSHSERYSDDQEVSKSSPNHAQSPEVSSNITGCEDNDTVKCLAEKLSAALLKIRAKEDLAKQHAKVAEEAVSGWEKAEKEVLSLKQQLETAVQKNTVLEDRISHLDGALKECVRQLRQSREEQEQRIQDAMGKKNNGWESEKFELESKIVELEAQLEAAKEVSASVRQLRQSREEQEERIQDEIIKKTNEWESEKFELQSQIIELEAQLETAKEVSSSFCRDLQMKIQAIEKENTVLKFQLHAKSEELNIRTLVGELSTRSAEAASKQHLESIKKVAKLEAECRRLRAMARKASSNDNKPFTNSVYVESLTDSQSDSGERLLALDNEPSCSDSWASALIAELDQFKTVGRNPTVSAVEIDLMDDFLEMEKLAASSEADHRSHLIDHVPAIVDTEDSLSRAKINDLLQRISELEEKIAKIENEKADMEILLTKTQDRLEHTCKQLEEGEVKVADLQRQLQLSNSLNQEMENAADAAEAKKKLLEFQVESADSEVQCLREKIGFLEGNIEEERVVSAELRLKCLKLENELLKRNQEAENQRAVVLNGELKIKQEKELAIAAGKFAECQKTIASLGHQLRSLGSLEDLMIQDEKTTLGEVSLVHINEGKGKLSLYNFSESTNDPTSLLNGKDTHYPLPESSSSFSGFGKSLA